MFTITRKNLYAVYGPILLLYIAIVINTYFEFGLSFMNVLLITIPLVLLVGLYINRSKEVRLKYSEQRVNDAQKYLVLSYVEQMKHCLVLNAIPVAMIMLGADFAADNRIAHIIVIVLGNLAATPFMPFIARITARSVIKQQQK